MTTYLQINKDAGEQSLLSVMRRTWENALCPLHVILLGKAGR
jgi:hypothetical protein